MEKSNEKALKIVEQQYTSFINLEDKWDFFRGLAGYVKTVQEMTQTKPFIEVLEKQREMARKVYEQMNTVASKQLRESAEKMSVIAKEVTRQYEPMAKMIQEATEPMTKIAQDMAEKYKPIINAMQELSDRLDGRIISSNPLSALNDDVFNVARYIKASGNAEAVKEFGDNSPKTQNIYGNYVFSPVYEDLYAEEMKVERKEQVEPWGAWQQLPLVKRLVYEPDEMTDELKKELNLDPSSQWNWLNFVGVVGELRMKCMTAFCESIRQSRLNCLTR